MRIWIAQINPTIGDFPGNSQKILERIPQALQAKADLLLFSELALTGYPPNDFLLHNEFLDAAHHTLEKIAKNVPKNLTLVIGTPRKNMHRLEKPCYNSAAILNDGKILGYQDKILLPTYDVFDERRYFESGTDIRLWSISGKKVAITICEDIWGHSDMLQYTFYSRDPVLELQNVKPDLLLNLSASPYSVGKISARIKVGCKTASTLQCPIILCNQVGGNDSLIFDGSSYVINSRSEVVKVAKAFQEDDVLVDTNALPSKVTMHFDSIEQLYQALVLGLRDYFQKSGFTKACLGLSGGIDSALVACLAAEALGANNVLAITMPSRFSSKESVTDSLQLAKTLGIELKDIPIESPFISYLEILQPIFNDRSFDVTEENIQARIRGMILMAISNKLGYIVLSTGNKSELALGYCTLYGDMCGGLGVISDVLKTQVYALAHWINREKEIIPLHIIQKPPSAELRPNQKDTDSLPEYSIVDPILKAYVEDLMPPEKIADKFGFPLELVQSLIRKIHLNEYKRRQSPPGLRVTEKAFSVGREFPIVQKWSV